MTIVNGLRILKFLKNLMIIRVRHQWWSTLKSEEQHVIDGNVRPIQQVVEVEEEESNSTNVVNDSGKPDDAVVASTTIESEAVEEHSTETDLAPKNVEFVDEDSNNTNVTEEIDDPAADTRSEVQIRDEDSNNTNVAEEIDASPEVQIRPDQIRSDQTRPEVQIRDEGSNNTNFVADIDEPDGNKTVEVEDNTTGAEEIDDTAADVTTGGEDNDADSKNNDWDLRKAEVQDPVHKAAQVQDPGGYDPDPQTPEATGKTPAESCRYQPVTEDWVGPHNNQVESNPRMSFKTWFLLLVSTMLMMTLGLGLLLVMRTSMMGICPTGGQANNILRYETFDTGGMYDKTFKSGGDGFDLALDEQHGVDIQVPPDSRGDVSDLQATADDNRGDDLHPPHVSAGVVLGTVEQGDAQLGVSGRGGYEPHNLSPATMNGCVDEILPDDRGDHQNGRALVQGRDDAHIHGGEADQEHAFRGDIHVRALHYYGGGGVAHDDVDPDKVAGDDAQDGTEVIIWNVQLLLLTGRCSEGDDGPPPQAPADEGGGADRVPHGGGNAVAKDKPGGEATTVHSLSDDTYVQPHQDEVPVDGHEHDNKGGDAPHGYGGDVTQVQVPVLTKMCPAAPANEGGGAVGVPPDDRGDVQHGRIQVQVRDNVHGDENLAPADEGGGPAQVLHAGDDAVAVRIQGAETEMVHDERGDTHGQAPEDEGGDLRAVDTQDDQALVEFVDSCCKTDTTGRYHRTV